MIKSKNIIRIGGREFNVILTASVIDKLQEEYKDLSTVLETAEDFKLQIKQIADITAVFVNDDIEAYNEDNPNDKKDYITSDWILRRVALNDTQTDDKKILATDLTLAIMQAFNISLPETDPNEQAPKTSE